MIHDRSWPNAQARGMEREVTRGNGFPLASYHTPLAWLLCDFSTNPMNNAGQPNPTVNH